MLPCSQIQQVFSFSQEVSNVDMISFYSDQLDILCLSEYHCLFDLQMLQMLFQKLKNNKFIQIILKDIMM